MQSRNGIQRKQHIHIPSLYAILSDHASAIASVFYLCASLSIADCCSCTIGVCSENVAADIAAVAAVALEAVAIRVSRRLFGVSVAWQVDVWEVDVVRVQRPWRRIRRGTAHGSESVVARLVVVVVE